MIATWIDRNTIQVTGNNLSDNVVVIYKGSLTSEVEAMLDGIGVHIPDRPPMTNAELAEALHESLCRWNHTDGCGWFYETGRVGMWENGDHKRWLDKATYLRETLPSFSETQLIDVALALRSI